jgi:hypothetical protein
VAVVLAVSGVVIAVVGPGERAALFASNVDGERGLKYQPRGARSVATITFFDVDVNVSF